VALTLLTLIGVLGGSTNESPATYVTGARQPLRLITVPSITVTIVSPG
jgi:hypothetical protein